MYTQIKYLASWTKVKLNERLGERGAEMVEYAIVLACIAAVGALFYSQGKTGESTLKGILTDLWTTVRTKLSGVIDTGSSNTTTPTT